MTSVLSGRLRNISEDSDSMVVILDGNSEHVAHAGRKTGLFREKKIRFATAFNLMP